MARVFPICSSSKGNSTFIGTRGHGILVDAGCSFSALKNALNLIDTDIDGIEAVFITHEHIDHVKALEMLIKHTNIPIFATRGTADALKEERKVPPDAVIYNIAEGYKSAQFEAESFKTSHDSAESVGYRIRCGEEYFGICTDTGVVTAEAEAALIGCTAVLLESNYDKGMLLKNPNYHADLKRRIMSEYGHLSNELCSRFAEKLVRGGTRHIILGHLSGENNTPETAKSCTRNYLAQCGLAEECDYTLSVAPIMTTGEYIAV